MNPKTVEGLAHKQTPSASKGDISVVQPWRYASKYEERRSFDRSE